MAFETNVFINCPFDEDYLPLLRPILFACLSVGLSPRIALERLDPGEPRIEKIIELIAESKFGIHDLSRLKAAKAGELYRLNMPLELGIDIGCKRFKPGQWANKKILILEAERYRYQAAISDLSNSDIAVHDNSPVETLTAVRNWLSHEAAFDADGPTRMWGAFTDFMAENYDALIVRGYSPRDIERLPVAELIGQMRAWIGRRIGIA